MCHISAYKVEAALQSTGVLQRKLIQTYGGRSTVTLHILLLLVRRRRVVDALLVRLYR